MTDIITPWPDRLPKKDFYRMPFYYASMKTLWAFYKVNPETCQRHLAGTGLKAARFGDDDGSETALACINIMAYNSEGSTFAGPTGEIEINVVAYAEADEGSVPTMSWKEFLWGDEQTKRVGFMRLFVLCDNPNAIQAGRALFGEHKFLVTFNYDIPSLNVNPDPSNQDGVQNLTSWQYLARKHTSKPMSSCPPEDKIFELKVDLSDLSPAAEINQTALLNFSMWSQFTEQQIDPSSSPEPPVGKQLVGTRRNFMGPFTAYYVDDTQGQRRVTLTYGGLDLFGTVSALEDILGPAADARACAVATYLSQPTIIESRAFFANVKN